MKDYTLSNKHQKVISILEKEHLTSFEILTKMEDVSQILVVYETIDELKAMGVLKSYYKEDLKYHYVA